MWTSSTSFAGFLCVLFVSMTFEVDVAYNNNDYFANEITTYYFVSAAIECVYCMTNPFGDV